MIIICHKCSNYLISSDFFVQFFFSVSVFLLVTKTCGNSYAKQILLFFQNTLLLEIHRYMSEWRPRSEFPVVETALHYLNRGCNCSFHLGKLRSGLLITQRDS